MTTDPAPPRAAPRARFSGRTALVTGGNRGIGRAIALSLAAEGARVAIACRDVAQGQVTVDEINADRDGEATRAAVFRCDVARDEDVRACVPDVTASLGAPTVLVCAAGTESDGPAAATEVDEDAWRAILEVNLTGAYRCAREVLPGMAKSGGGAIVLVSSIGGVEALARAAPYVASKTGLVGLMRSLALDYAPHGVRVSCICPGVIDTDMMRRSLARHENPTKLRVQLTAMHPVGRIGTPEDVAPAALFLASDEARWITGAVLVIDGGYTLRRFATAAPEL